MNFDIIEIIPDLSNESYHERDEISSSFIKSVAIHSVYHALHDEIDNMAALEFGDYFHRSMEGCLDETTEVFDDSDIKRQIYEAKYKDNPKYAGESPQKLMDKNIPMTNDYKQWDYEERQKISKDLIKANDKSKILKMRDNVLQDEIVSQMMSQYDYIDELSVIAVDRESGIHVRVRPDRLFYDKGGDPLNPLFWKCVIDWKTTTDITKVAKSVFKYRYDLQSIFYCDVLGIDYSNFYFTFVEKQLQHEVQNVTISKDNTIDRAIKDMELAFKDIERYLTTGDTRRSAQQILEL